MEAGTLILNPRSGDDDGGDLVRRAGRLGIDCVVLRAGDDPGEAARAAEGPVLGVAGGDGSLAAVAAVAIERDIPFVCVPAGTRNHFARDAGLDRRDPAAALGAFTDGIEHRIDAARVNGRLFLNNISLGLYADLVHRREHHRRRGEALAGLRALPRLAQEQHRLRARLDGETLRARILLVANNAYEVNLFTLGARSSLEEGRLHLYSADGWLPTSWEERSAERFRLELDRSEVVAAADGEPFTLRSPVEVESLPGVLRLLVPKGR